ncbi:glycosyltransferase [Stutzerimonas kunmingensis]|jgi:glycosyltransferase involved in cell wall biosynthesis|uniref:glycosyltransferase n=1 Tax=Stutzerimonas kunmingensis TaxID=1211807 RepID=UPI0035E40F6F
MDNLNPAVSLVIPVYNCKEYLPSAIDSILSQEYSPIECIVVDDGSNDGVEDVLEKYSDRIKIVRQKNSGQSAALQAGWEIATGDLFGYLSADDILYPGAISSLVSLYEPGVLAVYFGSYDYIDGDGNFVKSSNVKLCSYRYMAQNFFCPIGVGVIFSKGLFDKLGGWDGKFRQIPDLECWLRYGSLGRLISTNKRLGGFRVHIGSQTYRPSTIDRANEPLRVAELGVMENSKDISLRRFRASAHLLSACLHLRSGRPLVALRLFWRSLWITPLALFSLFQLRRIVGSVVGYLRLRKQGLI